jgi:hypothetical protein
MWKWVMGAVALLGIEHLVSYFLFKRAAASSSLPPCPVSGGLVPSGAVIKKIVERAVELHELGKKTDEIVSDIDFYINNG